MSADDYAGVVPAMYPQETSAAVPDQSIYADPVSGAAIEANAAAWDKVPTTSGGIAEIAQNVGAVITGGAGMIRDGARAVKELAGATVTTATQVVRGVGNAAEGVGNVGRNLPLLIIGALVVVVLVAQSGAVRVSR